MKTKITIDFLKQNGFEMFKKTCFSNGHIESYIKNDILFEFKSGTDIPLLKKKIDKDNFEFIAAVIHWENVENHLNPVIDSKENIKKEVIKKVDEYCKDNYQEFEFQTEGSLTENYKYFSLKDLKKALEICFEETYNRMKNEKN